MKLHKNFPVNKALLDIPAKDFKAHIEIPDNSRIIFSGKFGIGKTFFLDTFFKNESQEKYLGSIKYDSFHLFPVNYSIASNEDVFRYLKYDLISNFLFKGIQLDETDYKYIDTLPSFLKRNLPEVLATLVYMIPKLGKDIVENYDRLNELNEKFLKYAKATTASEGDKLIGFMERVESIEGGVFENDIITKLISRILERLKSESNHENVLIIDDLDRIDPEHVFRLLNIFASHLDNSDGIANKLGFDKVIFVCDIHNLRSIFSTKYGVETDFNGYVDKFYSHEIYYLDNREVLTNISYEAFQSVAFPNAHNQEVNGYTHYLFRSSSLALLLLKILISDGRINLRALISKISKKINLERSRYINFDEHLNVLQLANIVLTHFRILKEIVGDYDILKQHIKRVPRMAFPIDSMHQYINELVFFLNFKITFRSNGAIKVGVNGKEYNLLIDGRKLEEKLNNVKLVPFGGEDQHEYTIDEFLEILYDFIDLLKKVDN